MKKIPWNRFTKHLCVFVFLSLLSLGYFYSKFCLIPIVAMIIPLVHRIERDYRSTRKHCVRCRRWKPSDEFDITFCVACAEQVRVEKNRDYKLTHEHRHYLTIPLPIETPPRKPTFPDIRVVDPGFAKPR